jgi:hypothetical protein
VPRKVIVRLKGGLGNQMFCYAAARRLAWVNDAELVLDKVTGFKYDHLYQRTYALGIFRLPARLATPSEQMEPLGRLRRLISRKFSERKPLDRRRYIQQVGVDFDPGIVMLRLQEGTTYFDAFCQSEWYFADICELLLKDFAMSTLKDQHILELAKQIEATNSVALHVRWFDSGDAEHSSNMSLAYYAQAIRLLLSRVGHVHFFIFSDKPKQAAALLAPLIQGQSYTVVFHNVGSCGNAESDLWLMRQCRHFIIGNSTFAWWAAWLGEHCRDRTEVVVPARNVYPEHSVTAWGFPGLLPDRWTAI